MLEIQLYSLYSHKVILGIDLVKFETRAPFEKGGMFYLFSFQCLRESFPFLCDASSIVLT
jgi:hypothetical protein